MVRSRPSVYFDSPTSMTVRKGPQVAKSGLNSNNYRNQKYNALDHASSNFSGPPLSAMDISPEKRMLKLQMDEEKRFLDMINKVQMF